MNLSPKIDFLALISLLCGLLLLSNCRGDEDGADNDAPSFELISPMDGQVFESNENIPFSVKLSDASTIVSYKILIRNTITSDLDFIVSEFNSNNLVEESFDVSLEVPQQTTYNIEVEAIDDFDNKLDAVIGSFVVKRLEGGTLNLNFNVHYDDEPFELFKEYQYPGLGSIYFTRLSFYISKVTLKGVEDLEIKEVDFVNMTDHYENPSSIGTDYTYKIGGVKEGDYQSIQFNIGLEPEMNDNNPTDYRVTEPLGLSGEHWPPWNSYIFFKLEGRLDTLSGILDEDIAIHIGADEALRTFDFSQNIAISDDSDTDLNLNFDIMDIFAPENGAVYDIKTVPRIHSLEDIEQVIELADNLKKSIY